MRPFRHCSANGVSLFNQIASSLAVACDAIASVEERSGCTARRGVYTNGNAVACCIPLRALNAMLHAALNSQRCVPEMPRTRMVTDLGGDDFSEVTMMAVVAVLRRSVSMSEAQAHLCVQCARRSGMAIDAVHLRC
jgi:hypothetical protein